MSESSKVAEKDRQVAIVIKKEAQSLESALSSTLRKVDAEFKWDMMAIYETLNGHPLQAAFLSAVIKLYLPAVVSVVSEGSQHDLISTILDAVWGTRRISFTIVPEDYVGVAKTPHVWNGSTGLRFTQGVLDIYVKKSTFGSNIALIKLIKMRDIIGNVRSRKASQPETLNEKLAKQIVQDRKERLQKKPKQPKQVAGMFKWRVPHKYWTDQGNGHERSDAFHMAGEKWRARIYCVQTNVMLELYSPGRGSPKYKFDVEISVKVDHPSGDAKKAFNRTSTYNYDYNDYAEGPGDMFPSNDDAKEYLDMDGCMLLTIVVTFKGGQNTPNNSSSSSSAAAAKPGAPAKLQTTMDLSKSVEPLIRRELVGAKEEIAYTLSPLKPILGGEPATFEYDLGTVVEQFDEDSQQTKTIVSGAVFIYLPLAVQAIVRACDDDLVKSTLLESWTNKNISLAIVADDYAPSHKCAVVWTGSNGIRLSTSGVNTGSLEIIVKKGKWGENCELLKHVSIAELLMHVSSDKLPVVYRQAMRAHQFGIDRACQKVAGALTDPQGAAAVQPVSDTSIPASTASTMGPVANPSASQTTFTWNVEGDIKYLLSRADKEYKIDLSVMVHTVKSIARLLKRTCWVDPDVRETVLALCSKQAISFRVVDDLDELNAIVGAGPPSSRLIRGTHNGVWFDNGTLVAVTTPQDFGHFLDELEKLDLVQVL